MSVIIKGMTMPNTCYDCEFHQSGYPDWCDLSFISLDIDKTSRRPDWCPLVEIPDDHGDLIDRDALMACKGSAYDIDGHELYAVGTGTILRMPVVVPAERSEV